MADSPRDDVRQRLTDELGDAGLAEAAVGGLDDTAIATLAGDDPATTPLLSYAPPTAPLDEIDSLWILAFGYRPVDPGDTPVLGAGGPVPRREELLPGPVNEDLGRLVADLVAEHPMPVIAQWEVADVLQALWVPDVIPVDPDHDDGAPVYLSTHGVVEKGLRLAAEAGIEVGRAGVLAHHDHAGRCALTAAAAGLTAVVPEGVALPATYDSESAQSWTRSRADYIPLDLLARTALA